MDTANKTLLDLGAVVDGGGGRVNKYTDTHTFLWYL